jgi:hypothetical protein
VALRLGRPHGSRPHILAITTQTETANQRLRRIFASNQSTAIARIPPRVDQLESETQLLAAQVRSLIVERDRLAGRIALLESSIDDLTGTIKKQAAATAALAAKAAPPAPSAPLTAPPAAADRQAANAPSTPTPIATISVTPPNPDAVTTRTIPLPPARGTAAPAAESGAATSKQAEFGMDLGGGSTIEAIRQRWTTVKANFRPLLSGMHPLAAREQRPASTGYRLVVGPLPNSAAAAGLCAHFTAARTACRAVRFHGEQIAL